MSRALLAADSSLGTMKESLHEQENTLAETLRRKGKSEIENGIGKDHVSVFLRVSAPPREYFLSILPR